MSIKVLNGLDLANKKITNLATPTSSSDAANKAYADSVGGGGGGGGFLVGEIKEWSLPSLPSSEWLWCDGGPVTSSHPVLRQAYIDAGYPFGGPDGNGDPLTPDKRGRAAIGLDNMGGTSADRVTDANADSLGGSGGEEYHTLTVAEMPAHSHAAGGFLGAGPGSTRRQLDVLPSPEEVDTTSAGGGQAHNNMPPWMAINFIIYGGS